MNNDRINFVKQISDLLMEQKKLQRDIKLFEILSPEWIKMHHRLDDIRKELKKLQIGVIE